MSGKARRDRTVAAFSSAALLNDVGSDMIKPFWPGFVTMVLGAPMSFLGLLDGLGEATASLSRLPGGYLADRFRRRKPFIWFGYLLAVWARVGYALSSVARWLLPFHVLDRLGKLRDAPRDAMLAETVRREERGRAFGLLRALDQLGAALGPLLAYGLFATLGYRRLFFAASIPSLLGVMLILLVVKERKGVRVSARKVSLSGIGKNLRILTSVSGLFALSWFSISFMIQYATLLGLPTALLPLIYLVFSLTASLTSIPAGRLSDVIGRKPMLTLGYLLYAVTCAGFILTKDPFLAFVPFFLYGLHYGIIEPMQKAFVSDLSPSSIRATALGAYQTVYGLCALPASLAAGILWDLVGATAPFYYGIFLSLMSSFLLVLCVKEEHEKRVNEIFNLPKRSQISVLEKGR